MHKELRKLSQKAFGRRDFIQAAALGFFGGSLAAAEPVFTGNSERNACILIWNSGGLSQLDSWDPKPNAPSEIRGPFSAIATRGEFEISSAFPCHAKIGHLFSVVRGVHLNAAPLHDVATNVVLTGQLGEGKRSIADEFGASHRPSLFPGEPQCIRESYGLHSVGERFLSARQAIENGARFVMVEPFARDSWDIHGAAPYRTMDDFGTRLAPQYDQAASALIADLAERGLLETTLVVALSEFGRTPRLNADGGRDHWGDCWSIYFAGGGVQGGRAVGASDAFGSAPQDKGYTPQEVLATIRHAIGGDSETGSRHIAELF
jgi:hypothetical protein